MTLGACRPESEADQRRERPVQKNGGEIQQRQANEDGQDVDEAQASEPVLDEETRNDARPSAVRELIVLAGARIDGLR